MKQYIVLFALLCSVAGFGQNLVLNPGFEEMTSCPQPSMPEVTGPGLVEPWNNSPSGGTSNYFHACFPGWATTHYADNPPHSGQGYGGLIALRLSTCTYILPSRLREYLQGKLCIKLEAGKQYRLSFWVSLSTDSDIASDGIGICVSQTPPDAFGAWGKGVQLSPAEQSTTVLNPTGNIIGHGWQEVSGIITANGGEEYVTIGYFDPIFDPTVPTYDPNLVCGVYFDIDDVSVTEVTDQDFCEHTRWIENTTYPTDGVESAGLFIHSGYNVGYPTPNGNVTVIAGSEVEYVAGEAINLQPGFTASGGGDGFFLAHIVPDLCNYPDPAFVDAGEDIFVPCLASPPPVIGSPGSDCSENTYQWVADPPEALAWLTNPTSCWTSVVIPQSVYLEGVINGAQFMLLANPGMCDENADAVMVYLEHTPVDAYAGEDGVLNSAPICSNVVYLGEAITPGCTYSWSPAAGLNYPYYPNPSATYSPSLSYPVTYTVTVTSPDGCAQATDQVIVDYKASMNCELDLSTGYVNGAMTTNGDDDYWRYIADHDSPITPVPMKASNTLSSVYWVANNAPYSRWIKPPGSGTFPEDDYNGHYRFERKFVINSDPDDISDVKLYVYGVALDNSGYFFVNGNQIFNPGSPGDLMWIDPDDEEAISNFNTLHAFPSPVTIDMNDLNPGSNSLMVDMNNEMGVDSYLGMQLYAKLKYKSCRPCSQAIINPGSNGGGSGSGSGGPKSMLEENNGLFTIYPNPNNGTFTIEILPVESETELVILNAVGETVWEERLTQARTEIRLGDLSAGIYIAKVVQNGIESIAKIVIE